MTSDAGTGGAAARTEKVSIGEFRLAGPAERLIIHGLGSCVALLLHEPRVGVSALGHFLLPSPPSDNAPGIPGRFVATAVPAMVEALRDRGGDPARLLAKVAGAAQMFQYERASEREGVGARNLQATREALEGLGIPIVGEDTGGSYGRTVTVEGGSGRMEVRAVRVEERVL